MNSNKQTVRRQIRIRRKIRGTSNLPRLNVFRSNRHVFAQIIDDTKKQTIIGLVDKGTKGPKIATAKELGRALAKAALAKKVTEVVFDKGSYAYHGRVKAIAEGAREGGLQF